MFFEIFLFLILDKSVVKVSCIYENIGIPLGNYYTP